MEPYFDDEQEDDREFLARCEERRRRRLERQRRLRKRRLIKRYLCLGICAVLAAAVFFAVKSGRKPEAEKAALDIRPMDTLSPTEEPISDDLAKMLKEAREKAGITDAAQPEEDSPAPEAEPPVYQFTATEDTVTITNAEVNSTNAILVDENANVILASKGAKERIYPASMTKVLTVLVAAEQISEEDLNDTFTMTLEITDYAYVNDCSAVGFSDGEEVPVRDLFYGTVLPSGGDAALGLATYVAGSHEAFVELMNEKLEELGISDSAHFTNCIGLYDDNHYCSVYDMAVIMKAAMQNDLCREVLSAHTYTTTATDEHPEGIPISNWFLRKIEDKDMGGEVLCGKTGYVVQSKNCAVSCGTVRGVSYICVTTGAHSNWRCIYDHVEIYNSYVPAPQSEGSSDTAD